MARLVVSARLVDRRIFAVIVRAAAVRLRLVVILAVLAVLAVLLVVVAFAVVSGAVVPRLMRLARPVRAVFPVR
jgi:hypothetical protein